MNLILDRAGTFASGLCIAHCVGMLLVTVLLPTVGLGVLQHPSVEWVFVFIAVAIALFAATRPIRGSGWTGPRVALLAGAALLSFGRVVEAFHLFPGAMALSVSGGSLLVIAHIVRARRCATCTPAADAMA